MVLDTLADVTIASPANLDFLRYETSSTQWKKYTLGALSYTAGSPNQLALDGGGGGTAAVIGIGHASSHMMLSGNSRLDFLLSGSVTAGTDVSLRMRAVSATQFSIYDQALAGTSDGTEVMRYAPNSVAANRYFEFILLPVYISGGYSLEMSNGYGGITMRPPGAADWACRQIVSLTAGIQITIPGTLASGAITAFYAYTGTNNDMDIRLGQLSGSSASQANTVTSYANLTIWATSGSGGTTSLLKAEGDVNLAGATKKFGAFGSVGTVRVAVAAPAAITAIGGADATYSANEQTLLNALTADVVALRLALNNLRTALNGYNLV